MGQISFTEAEYSKRRRRTKREEFLDLMDGIIPWKEWEEIIRPYYYKNTRGRRAKDIETMLRMYLMQNWFNLSDEGIEDAIYDSYAMKKFLKIDFNEESVPDATTLLKFRHMLEQNLIGAKIFADVKRRLDSVGLMMHGGTIVDATIVEAPSSTKNQDRERDPEMHQTKKGNQWHYGMKVHIGVDAGTGYVHTITATAANVHDIEEAPKLLREDDTVGYGDAGYLGIQNRPEIKNDPNLKNIDFRINKRPSSIKVTEKIYSGFNWDKYIESRKSSVRCKVEHAFLIIKREFGYVKVAYRGIAKNLNRFNILFASANLLMCLRAGRGNEFIKA
jgi:IS5 family transposase